MRSSKNFIIRYVEKLPVRLLILLILFGGALFLFGFITHQVLLEKEEAVDHQVFGFLSTHVIHPEMTKVMEVISFFASSRFMQIGYAALVLLYLFQKDFKRPIEIAIIGLGGFAVNYFMKISFQRERPPNALIDPLHNFSFPSGHATSAFIFYGLLIYLVWKTDIRKTYKYIIGSILTLFALLIGFSRVYLRLHYATDVLAGFCIGFAWLFLTVWLFERMKKKSHEENVKN